MGLFDFFGTGIISAATDKIIKGIKGTDSYRYFAEGDSRMISEYKDFECNLVGCAVAAVALKIDLKSANQKKDLQTVYIGKSAAFVRKLISNEYHVAELPVDKEKAELFFKKDIEAMMCFQLHVKVEKYATEVGSALVDHSPFYFLHFKRPRINDFTGEEELGEQRLCSFIYNTLLAQKDASFGHDDDANLIDYKAYVDLSEQEIEYLHLFVRDLKKIAAT